MNEDDFQTFVHDVIQGCEDHRQIVQRSHSSRPAIASSSGCVGVVARIAQTSSIKYQQRENDIFADKIALQSVVNISRSLINDPTIREKIKTIATNTISNLQQQLRDHTYNAEEQDETDFHMMAPNSVMEKSIEHEELIVEEIPQQDFVRPPNSNDFKIHQPSPSKEVHVPPATMDDGFLDTIVGSFQSFFSYISHMFSTHDSHIEEGYSYKPMANSHGLQSDFHSLENSIPYIENDKEDDHFVESMIAASLFLVSGFVFSCVLKKYAPDLSKSFTETLTKMFVRRNSK
jgi:hypothetical protein